MHKVIEKVWDRPVFLLLLLAGVLEFWQLGQHPVNSFDEARFGANAHEMAHNKDFFNLYYQGEPDAWVARPPLKAWLIMVGYKLVGCNEWGLRLSSGVFILVFFFFTYQWLRLYFEKGKAFLACLLLLSVKGIIGFHVGRNGDMDAELLAFLAGFLYFFLQYLHFGRPKAIIWAFVFLSLAFWLKTVAAFFYLPGIFLYLVFSKQLVRMWKDRNVWLACAVLFASILAWVLIVVFFGTRYENTRYAGDNALQTMLVYDVWMRFTASNFDGHPVVASYDFFFTNLDSRFNVWNYFFYAGLGLFLFRRTKGLGIASPYDRLLPLFAWTTLPVFVLLTLGMHKLDWYSAPLYPLLTVFVLFIVDQITMRLTWFKWLALATLVFTCGRHVLYVNEERYLRNEASFFEENIKTIGAPDTLWVVGDLSQNIYLKMLWAFPQVKVVKSQEEFAQTPGRVGLRFSSAKQEHTEILAHYQDERLGVNVDIVKSTR